MPCSAGYASSAGSGSCTACTAGYYSGGLQETCMLCPEGSFGNAVTAATACSVCPAGTAATVPVSASCLDCDAGYYSAGNTSQCSACAFGVTSAKRSPRCNVYNGSATATTPITASLETGEWKCFTHSISSVSNGTALMTYVLWDRQTAIEASASCLVSGWNSLPMSPSLGQTLNLSVSNVSVLAAPNSWLSAATCFVCLKTLTAVNPVQVALFESTLVGQNNAVTISNLEPGIPKYVSTSAQVEIATLLKSVDVSITVSGGSVKVYYSSTNPTPSSSDCEVVDLIAATGSLPVALNRQFIIPYDGAMYLGILSTASPTPAGIITLSGSTPTVTVAWTISSAIPRSESESSGWKSGEIVALVMGLLIFVIALYLGFRRYTEHNNQKNSVNELQSLAIDPVVIAEGKSEVSMLPPIPQSTVVEEDTVACSIEEPHKEDSPAPYVAQPPPEVAAEKVTPEDVAVDLSVADQEGATESMTTVTLEAASEVENAEQAVQMLQNLTPVLGVIVQDSVRDGGVRIKFVPATMTQFGLQKGDVVIGINGTEITNRAELRSIVRSRVVGDTLSLCVKRENSIVDLQWIVQAAGCSPEIVQMLQEKSQLKRS
eukprot:ANDGO_05186.mRNA.1 protein serine/threonine kinase